MQLAEFRRSTLWFGIHRVNRDETLWKRRLIDWSHLCSRDPIKGIALCSVCTRLPAGLGMLVVHPYNWLMHACIACIHELSENMEIQKLLQHSMAASVEKRLRDDLGTPKVLKRDVVWFHSNPPRANTSEKFQKHPTWDDRNRVTTKEETSLKSPLCIHKKAWKWMNPCEPQSSYISTCEGTSPDLS